MGLCGTVGLLSYSSVPGSTEKNLRGSWRAMMKIILVDTSNFKYQQKLTLGHKVTFIFFCKCLSIFFISLILSKYITLV